MSIPTPLFRLQLLGDLAIYGRDGTRIGEARRKPLAVLAYLAAEAPRAVNREQLAALLWPDTSPEKARRALAQTLYALRRELGADVVRGVSQLTLDGNLVASDLAAFRDAIGRRDVAAAAVQYAGPFLDGMHVAGAAEFEQWAEGWRGRLERMWAPLASPPTLPEPLLARAASREPRQEPLVASTTMPPRTGRLPAFALRAAILTLIVGGSAGAVGWAKARMTPEPETAFEVDLAAVRRLQAERRARIDSATIGRVLILPGEVVTEHPTAQRLATDLGRLLPSRLHDLYTSAVPARDAARIRQEVLDETARWPTTSALQIARMMQRSGTVLAIQPVVRWRNDSLILQLAFHRSIAHTSQAARGYANLESLTAVPMRMMDTQLERAIDSTSSIVHDFVRSLETCDAADHQERGDAPWCWGKGRQLVVPAGLVDRMVWVLRRQRRS